MVGRAGNVPEAYVGCSGHEPGHQVNAQVHFSRSWCHEVVEAGNDIAQLALITTNLHCARVERSQEPRQVHRKETRAADSSMRLDWTFADLSREIGQIAKDQLKSLRERGISEARRLFWIFAYLWVLLGLFALHKSIVLNEPDLFYHQGFAVINALVLAKIMFVAEALQVADDLKH